MKILFICASILSTSAMVEKMSGDSAEVLSSSMVAHVFGGVTCYQFGFNNDCEIIMEGDCGSEANFCDPIPQVPFFKCKSVRLHQPTAFWDDECETKDDGWEFGHENCLTNSIWCKQYAKCNGCTPNGSGGAHCKNGLPLGGSVFDADKHTHYYPSGAEEDCLPEVG